MVARSDSLDKIQKKHRMSTKDELEAYFLRDAWEKQADQQINKEFKGYHMDRSELQDP